MSMLSYMIVTPKTTEKMASELFPMLKDRKKKFSNWLSEVMFHAISSQKTAI
jgi:hypothetical protein